MPKKRRSLFALTGSMAGITAALVTAPSAASAQTGAPASKPWFVYAAGTAGAIRTFPVGATTASGPIIERPLLSTAGSSVISPDGKTLYVTSLIGTSMFVTPYDTVTGKAETPIFVGLSQYDGPMALSPDGSTLYLATLDPTVGSQGESIIAVSTRAKQTRTLATDIGAAVTSLAVSPDGKELYGGYIVVSPGIFALDTAT